MVKDDGQWLVVANDSAHCNKTSCTSQPWTGQATTAQLQLTVDRASQEIGFKLGLTVTINYGLNIDK